MKSRYVLLLDLPPDAVAASAAFTARFDIAFYNRRELTTYLIAALLIKPVIFFLAGMYRRYWRYTSIPDLAVVFTAVTVSSVVMWVFVAFGIRRLFDEFSRVVIVNDWLLTMAVAGGLRVGIRVLGEWTFARPGSRASGALQRILIVGAGAAGTMVAREMR